MYLLCYCVVTRSSFDVTCCLDMRLNTFSWSCTWTAAPVLDVCHRDIWRVLVLGQICCYSFVTSFQSSGWVGLHDFCFWSFKFWLALSSLSLNWIFSFLSLESLVFLNLTSKQVPFREYICLWNRIKIFIITAGLCLDLNRFIGSEQWLRFSFMCERSTLLPLQKGGLVCCSNLFDWWEGSMASAQIYLDLFLCFNNIIMM